MDRMDLINPIQLPNNTIQHNTTQPTNEPTKQPTNKPTKTNQPNNQQLYNIRYKMFDLIENDSNHWAVFISIEPLLLRTNQKKKNKQTGNLILCHPSLACNNWDYSRFLKFGEALYLTSRTCLLDSNGYHNMNWRVNRTLTITYRYNTTTTTTTTTTYNRKKNSFHNIVDDRFWNRINIIVARTLGFARKQSKHYSQLYQWYFLVSQKKNKQINKFNKMCRYRVVGSEN